MQHYAIVAVKDNTPVLDPSDLHHATKVMRMKEGEEFVAIWQNARHLCVIKSITPFNAVFTGKTLTSNESSVHVTVLLAVIKPVNFELAVQKCVESGVKSIQPVITARSQRHELNIPRLQRIAKEAAEQSNRDYVPLIKAPMKLSEAISVEGVSKCLLDPSFEHGIQSFAMTLSKECLLAVGPEGGWDKQEIAMMVDKGFVGCSIGKTVLRAETAAIVATHSLCWSEKGS